MKQFNNKNLRREVRRQLKELHGRVSEMAVSELKIKSTDCENIVDAIMNEEPVGAEVNGEGATTYYPLRPTGSSPLKGDSAGIVEESNQKELSPFKGDADAKGASVATTGTSVSQRSPQKAYRERSERNGGGNSAPNADTDLMINGERLTKNDEGLTINNEGLTINNERLAVSGEQLEGSDEGDIFNSQFSIVKVCANERESS